MFQYVTKHPITPTKSTTPWPNCIYKYVQRKSVASNVPKHKLRQPTSSKAHSYRRKWYMNIAAHTNKQRVRQNQGIQGKLGCVAEIAGHAHTVPVPCRTFFFHNFVGRIDPSQLRNSSRSRIHSILQHIGKYEMKYNAMDKKTYRGNLNAVLCSKWH